MTGRTARVAATAEPRKGSTNYPEPFRRLFDGRTKRPLGDQFGLDQFGVNLTELAPGAMSALRHWHSHEDEFVYVLEGEVTLVNDDGEERIATGECVGFKAGVANAHHLVNRTSAPARYLEIGSRRIEVDHCAYPDDVAVAPDGGGKRRILHKDGTPY